jgi:hypothetical protein
MCELEVWVPLPGLKADMTNLRASQLRLQLWVLKYASHGLVLSFWVDGPYSVPLHAFL